VGRLRSSSPGGSGDTLASANHGERRKERWDEKIKVGWPPLAVGRGYSRRELGLGGSFRIRRMHQNGGKKMSEYTGRSCVTPAEGNTGRTGGGRVRGQTEIRRRRLQRSNSKKRRRNGKTRCAVALYYWANTRRQNRVRERANLIGCTDFGDQRIVREQPRERRRKSKRRRRHRRIGFVRGGESR